MAWTVTDVATVVSLREAGEPPTDLGTFFADPTWYWAWQLWAGEQAQDGDDVPWNAGAFLAALASGDAVADTAATFVGDGAPNRVQLPVGLEIRVDRLLRGEPDEDADALRDSVWDAVSNTVFGYLGAFVADLREVQANTQLEAQQDVEGSGITRDHVVESEVDERNQYFLKDLDEGTSIGFCQSGDLVLIGQGHHPLYYAWVRSQPDATEGSITMEEKGSGFSTGSISVTGYGDPDAFKAAIRRFSKKKIDFQ
jgi:hypothetical protein